MVDVKYEDLSEAFDFVSSAAPMEHHAYISLDSGTIHWLSENGAFENDELPDSLEESDRYIEVPHKNDLDLGRSLALRFAEQALPSQYDTVARIFQRRGAYARFKDLLASANRLEEWYAFSDQCTDEALRAWCEENGIRLIDTRDERGASVNSPDLVMLSTFRSTAEAQIAKGVLDEAGIDSMIRSDDAGGMYPAIGGAELLVRSEDVEKARQVLHGRHESG